MDFGLSPEQRQFADAVARLLVELAPVERVLRRADGDGFDAELWAALVALGAPATGLPVEVGGLGGNCLDAAVLAEAVGRAVTPVPSIAPWHLAPWLLARCGGEQERLGAVADGTARFAVALAEAGCAIDLRHDKDTLTGTVATLPEGAHATHLLLLDGDEARLVDLSDARATVLPLPSLDRTVPLAELRLEACPAIALDPAIAAPATRAELVDRARVLLAAQSVGAAQAMLDAAVDYVQLRRQFGQPLAAFQSVRHACAEMATALEPARALVWYAAHAIDIASPEARTTAAHAKAHADEVCREVATVATQLHGAIGFTHDLGLHLRLKRIATNRQLYGTPEQCRAEAAAAQGLG